jgi:hypothetical protein
MHTVEKILMRQAQEQFIKLQDVNSAAPITTNAAGIPNLLEVSKSPAQDDLIIKIAKLLQSPPTVGGPSDQNVIETQTETQTRNTTIRDGEAKPVQLLD